MWQQLINVLNKLCNTYDEFTKLGEKKRTALVAVNKDALSRILEQERFIIASIQTLEQQRGLIVSKILSGRSDLNSETTVEDFYKSAPTPFVTKKLMEIHSQLSQNVERTLKLYEHNQILAQNALDNVTVKLNKISGAVVEPTYGIQGSVVTHQKKFDYKA